jgi:hypothetical protein
MDDFGVVYEAVDHGGGYLDLVRRIRPLTQGFVLWTCVHGDSEAYRAVLICSRRMSPWPASRAKSSIRSR